MAALFRRRSQVWANHRVNGRQYRRSEGNGTKRVAKARLRRRALELVLSESVPASELPVAAIVSAFCEHLKMRCPHKSYKNDVGRLRAFFGQICGELTLGRPGKGGGKIGSTPYPDKFAHAHVRVKLLEDVTPAMINRFIGDRIRDDAWAAKTANDFREVLHRLFAFAIKHHGFCSRERRYPNPVAAVERQREPAPQIRFLSLEQIEVQLRILKGHPVIWALVATYIYAGLRREEALWLTREDLDLERRMIKIQAKTIEGQKWQPKTRRNRAVPISETLLGILRTYQPPHRGAWFFPSPKGKRWHPDNFSQELRKINAAHGLAWGCLDFRHSFGSQLAQKGESLFKIATLMGNSPAICQRHYAALIPETMHDTVEFPSREPKVVASPDGPQEVATRNLMERLLRELQARQSAPPPEPRPGP